MASAPGASAPQPAMTMLSAESITVHSGKFTQVLGDYHVHGNVSTHINPSDEASDFLNSPSLAIDGASNPKKQVGVESVQAGRDYVVHGDHHHHVHYHYPVTKRRSSPQNITPDIIIERVSWSSPEWEHYHVYREHKFMFCTQYSPVYRKKQFPVNPSYAAMTKYASIILDELDPHQVPRFGIRRNYSLYAPMKTWDEYSPYIPYKPQTKSPRRNLAHFIPPFDLHIPEGNDENPHDLPCVKAHAAVYKYSASATSSPRSALFSHLDHAGVK